MEAVLIVTTRNTPWAGFALGGLRNAVDGRWRRGAGGVSLICLFLLSERYQSVLSFYSGKRTWNREVVRGFRDSGDF